MVIDLKNCTIKIKDGGANFVTVKIGNGNLTYDEKHNLEYIKDRGKRDTVRLGDEDPIDVRLDAQWSFLTGTSAATVEDALKRRGPAASWASSSSDPCEPYAVDIEITNNVPCFGIMTETILLQDFRHTSIAHDPKAGTLSITGTCNVKEAQVTRSGASS